MRHVATAMTQNELPIDVDPDVMSGEPVFKGTRVPVSALLENLEVGVSIDEFLENFPSVGREQTDQILDYVKSILKEIKKAA